ncbi:MAG: site-2 protease family protein [Myxococcota bacterium]|nr:site-2 protease family protein [Myxococcota bacterium]
MDISHFHILLMGAWFVQMGAHEGAHAYIASYCGDDTASHLGKKSFNPLDHIEWNSFNSIFLSVILPCLTALQGLPIGMAWVPVNPRKLRKPVRDMAWISFAGPAANLIVMFACIILHALLSPLGVSEASDGFFRIIWMLDEFLLAICLTSAIYGFFNLVPIPPLDGSKVLYNFLPQAAREVMDNIAPYGMFVILILFWIGNAGVIFTYPMFAVHIAWSLF